MNIRTKGGPIAAALFTFGGAIPEGEANFKVTLDGIKAFQIINYGEDNVPLEVRLANHTDEESVDIVCFPGQPTFELVREIITEIPVGVVLNWGS